MKHTSALILLALAAIAVAFGIIGYGEHVSTVDAEHPDWDVLSDYSDGLYVMEHGLLTQVKSLDDAGTDDVLVIGREWMEAHDTPGVKEKVNGIIESGTRVLTGGGSLLAFETFMERHSYEFSADDDIHGAMYLADSDHVRTLNMTVDDIHGLNEWITRWSTAFTHAAWKDPGTDWWCGLSSTTVETLWEGGGNYVFKNRVYLTAIDSIWSYAAVIDDSVCLVNGGLSDTRNELLKVRFGASVDPDGDDRITGFSPTQETYTRGWTPLPGYGNLSHENACPEDVFVSKYRLPERYSVEYGISDALNTSSTTVNPGFSLESEDGTMEFSSEMSYTVHKEGDDRCLRYSYAFDTVLRGIWWHPY